MLTTLGQVLETADTLPWNHALYLPYDELWSKVTPCAVLDPDDVEIEEEEPLLAREQGYEYVLGIAIIRQIVSNICQKSDAVDVDVLLKAFLYYYDNDAFYDTAESVD